MARIARVVVPGLPHHITQRGNRRQRTFFVEDDYRRYLDLMAEWCDRCGVEIWAYCLMPNHVHLIAVPGSEADLRRAIGEAHRRYTDAINRRERWQGHLWQGRFTSIAMDERYLLAAARYVELNPVRGGLTDTPWGHPWSSAGAHLCGLNDVLARVKPLLERVPDWAAFLGAAPDETVGAELRAHELTGRPLGSEVFVERLEAQLGRALRAPPRGRPARPPAAPGLAELDGVPI